MIKILLIVIYTLCLIKVIKTKDCSLDDSTGYYESKIGDNLKIIDMKIIHDDSLTKVKLKSNLSFFDQTYQGVIISKDGFIKLVKSFSRRENIRLSSYNQIQFPISEPLLFPFMADVLAESNLNTEIVYRFVEDQETLSEIECDLARFDSNLNLKIEWSLIITWNNVYPSGYKIGKHKASNTFQLGLVKCERETYLIYNYAKIEWPDKKMKKFAYLGYDAGDSLNFHLVTSQENITEALKNSNVGMPSKWIFRVDSKYPSTTSDTTTTDISSTIASSSYLSNSSTVSGSNNVETSISYSTVINPTSTGIKNSENQSNSIVNSNNLTLIITDKDQNVNFHTTISSTNSKKNFITESTSTMMSAVYNVTTKSITKSTQNRTYSPGMQEQKSTFITVRVLFIISVVCLLVGFVNLIVFLAICFHRSKTFNSTRLKDNDDSMYNVKLEILNSEDS